MKRQLDRLKGKRLVTGDPNLMTKDEICINATPNGVEVKEIGTDGSIKDIASGSSEGGSDAIYKYYYRINTNLDEMLGYMPMYYYMYKLHRFKTTDTNESVGIEEQIMIGTNYYPSVVIKVRMDKFPTLGSSSDGKGSIINIENLCNTLNLPYPIDIIELLSLETGSKETVLESIRPATEKEIQSFEDNITIRNNLY